MWEILSDIVDFIVVSSIVGVAILYIYFSLDDADKWDKI